MIELRDYQCDLLERVQKALEPENARVIMQLPTGGGKTVIAAHLLAGYLTDGRKAVWLTHRTELARQTRKMLNETTGVRAAYLERSPQAPIPAIADGAVILMAQTAGRRANSLDVWSKYDSNDLMIIDEAHHSAADGYERAMSRWPGRVLGMTATPWRLSENEGFDHLFSGLICGPQVSELQTVNFLCEARVLMPPPDERIRGGEVGSIGDYTETGIERANEDHPDIMTAGALKLWQEHAYGRQTIAYAVSVRHAQNLVRVFREADTPAELMLGDTPLDERASTIENFRNGNLQVLVNVAVATEGFDLPDASCVVLARPTESLALYLQMVGRGLRPKDGGDCIILDLAGNSMKHGLPEERREWSLVPRGAPLEGESPLVWCENCGTTSPAASHDCGHCGAPFGADCQRCGKWRAWKRWILKDSCQYTHDNVCDLCHKDAHSQAHLPVTEEMERLAREDDDGDYEVVIDHDQLDERLSLLIRELLKSERDYFLGQYKARQDKLRDFVANEDGDLRNNEILDRQFEAYLEAIPQGQRPRNFPQKADMYGKWKGERRTALTASRDELAKLEAQSVDIDMPAVFESVQSRLMRILRREVELLDQPPDGSVASCRETSGQAVSFTSEWVPLTQLEPSGLIPKAVGFPSGEQSVVNSWAGSLVEIANWLIVRDKLSRSDCPVITGKARANCLINTIPRHPNGKVFGGKRSLTKGMVIYTGFNAKATVRQSMNLLLKFGEEPSQFYVRL